MAMHKELDMTQVHTSYEYQADGTLKSIHPWRTRNESLLPVGYRYAAIGDRLVPSHRVVWALHHGDPGDKDIDHIDGDKLNNRIENLRLANRSQNNQNNPFPQSNNKTSGVRGVHFDKARGKWAAAIRVDGIDYKLGRFDTKEEAVFARKQGEAKYHPFKQ